jgi:protein-S-isoprenylcysteine O-methyltransferase Ste14
LFRFKRNGSRDSDWRERPNVVPWPPIFFVGAVAAAVILEYLLPLDGLLPMRGAVRLTGAAAMLAGIALDVAAMLEMHRAKANIQPHRAATSLVTTGPFALSRNPIYLGNTALIGGGGLALGNLWLVRMAVVTLRLVSVLAVSREELHLAARFGDAWTAYAKRTPRWLRLRS